MNRRLSKKRRLSVLSGSGGHYWSSSAYSSAGAYAYSLTDGTFTINKVDSGMPSESTAGFPRQARTVPEKR